MESLTKPEGVRLVVAGVDVQARYLAVLVAGFSVAREMWLLDYFQVDGDVRDAVTLPSAIRDLVAAGCNLIGVDSGYATDSVYAATHGRRGVYATKGVGGREGEPVVIPTPHSAGSKHHGPRALLINADEGKCELAAMLGTKEPGRNYVHVPKRLAASLAPQLTSEERIPVWDAAGVLTGHRWQLKKSARNEALDCAVICLALFHAMTPTAWRALLSAGLPAPPPTEAGRLSGNERVSRRSAYLEASK
jgi:phage terminase large subunit GpA-like protein